jgi:hypothetical protein
MTALARDQILPVLIGAFRGGKNSSRKMLDIFFCIGIIYKCS